MGGISNPRNPLAVEPDHSCNPACASSKPKVKQVSMVTAIVTMTIRGPRRPCP